MPRIVVIFASRNSSNSHSGQPTLNASFTAESRGGPGGSEPPHRMPGMCRVSGRRSTWLRQLDGFDRVCSEPLVNEPVQVRVCWHDAWHDGRHSSSSRGALRDARCGISAGRAHRVLARCPRNASAGRSTVERPSPILSPKPRGPGATRTARTAPRPVGPAAYCPHPRCPYVCKTRVRCCVPLVPARRPPLTCDARRRRS
jgi:hypothetical protein